MNQARRIFATIALCALLLPVAVANASVQVYTDRAAFLSALNQAQTLDFEAQSPGLIIADGDAVGGITFNYDFGGVQLQVSDMFDTTSPTNFLGTDDGDVLQGGDDLQFTFGAKNAIGLSIISPDELLDGDFVLMAGATSVSLDATAVQQTLGDGGKVYFLGIVDTLMNSISSAALTTTDGGFFLYNVDDVTTNALAAVPEAGAIWLVSLVSLSVGCGAGRRSLARFSKKLLSR